MTGPSPLQVTIVGGYLGAGKTTLVNHLLRNADGLRLAVLVNEFGELPIDADLIEAQDDKVISIAGGCVCCSYGNDLMLAMMDLEKMDPRPDHILLESSGVAIPGAIAASIGLLSGFSVDGIVILADAETIRKSAADRYVGETVTRQLRDADIIVLNKTDLVTEQNEQSLRHWLSHIAPGSTAVSAVRGALPPTVVLESFLGRQRPVGQRHQPDIFQTHSFDLNGPVDVIALAEGLAAQEVGLVRAKGFALSADNKRYAIQVVGRRWAVTEADDNVRCGIVCIGMKSVIDAGLLGQIVAERVTAAAGVPT